VCKLAENQDYKVAEALSVSIIDLIPISNKKDCFEGEGAGEEILNLVRKYKKINNQELRYALIKSLFEGIR